MTAIELFVSGLGSGRFSWEALMELPGSVADAGSVAAGAVGVAVPVASILAAAAIDPAATHATVLSRDERYTASIPIATLRDGGWLAIALDGAPLPADRGGPLRLTVADGDTLCWNVKDVGRIRCTEGPEPDTVPENPPH